MKCALSRKTHTGDLWISLNPICLVPLGGASNGFSQYSERAKNKDFLFDCWLLVQAKPDNLKSSEGLGAKLEEAGEICHGIYSWLEEMGAPRKSMFVAVVEESVYLFVRLIGYEIKEELIEKKMQILTHIADRFSTDNVAIEPHYYDPSARIKLNISSQVEYLFQSITVERGEPSTIARQIEEFDLYTFSDKLLAPEPSPAISAQLDVAETKIEAFHEVREMDAQHTEPLRSSDLLERAKGIEVHTIRLSEVKAEQIDWLWYPYIPKGKVTLIEGDPGVGKSWLTLAIATAISKGYGLPNSKPMEPRNVLVLSAEDGLADTIKPRLIKLGADMERIIAYVGAVTLDDKGLDKIMGSIVEYDALLVIIDPLVAYIGSKIDMYRANETRPVMAALAKIAERYMCAILGVRHLHKGEKRNSIYSGIGSIDLAASARSALLVGTDDKLTTEGIVVSGMVQNKSNLGATGEPIGFQISDEGFKWLPSTNLTKERILRGNLQEIKTKKIDEAKTLLESLLANGPRPAAEIERIAQIVGISGGTLQRAREELGVHSRKHGQPGAKGQHWEWMLSVNALKG